MAKEKAFLHICIAPQGSRTGRTGQAETSSPNVITVEEKHLRAELRHSRRGSEDGRVKGGAWHLMRCRFPPPPPVLRLVGNRRVYL